MISSHHLIRALALLLSAGLLTGCKEPSSPSPAPSASSPAPHPSSVASTAPSTVDSAAARPAPKEEVDTTVVIGERQTFHSTILAEDRTILVHTPASYKKSNAAYPVLYLLDGEENFHHTTGITSFLSHRGRAPETIVIGVVNTPDSRDRDMTPTALKDRPGGGAAAKFLSFFKDELQPRVEGAYRTRPYRILVGHSFGALFALYTLTNAPDTFNAYIAMSPSLWWDDRRLLHDAEKNLSSHQGLEAFLYLTTGNEPGHMLEDIQSFTALLEAKGPKGLQWSFKRLEHESHMSLPHRSTYDGLETLFTGWEAPPDVTTVKALRTHYEALSKKFHYEVKLTEEMLDSFAFGQMERHHDEAMAAFKLAVELYPDSPSAYDTLCSAHEEAGQLDLAKTNCEIAVRKGTETSDPDLASMKAHLERVSKPKAK